MTQNLSPSVLPGDTSVAARRWSLAFLAGIAVVLLVFKLKPGWDIALSEAFFTPLACDKVRILWGSNPQGVRCGEFVYEHLSGWKSLRAFFKNLPFVAGGLTLVWLLWTLFTLHRKRWETLFLPSVAFGSLVLGPMIIINLFKEISGRSRPIHSLEFGGFEPFTAVTDFSGKCDKNCSFLSGEASGAFWLLIFVALLPRKWRWPVGSVVFAMACLASMMRVMFGRHFVSDITISALVTLLAISLFWWLFASAAGQRILRRMKRNSVELHQRIKPSGL